MMVLNLHLDGLRQCQQHKAKISPDPPLHDHIVVVSKETALFLVTATRYSCRIISNEVSGPTQQQLHNYYLFAPQLQLYAPEASCVALFGYQEPVEMNIVYISVNSGQ